MFKSLFLLSVLLVVKILATPLNNRPMQLEEVRVLPEEPCMMQGGICTHNKHCEPEFTVKLADLCPKQSHFGVVCCYLN